MICAKEKMRFELDVKYFTNDCFHSASPFFSRLRMIRTFQSTAGKDFLRFFLMDFLQIFDPSPLDFANVGRYSSARDHEIA